MTFIRITDILLFTGSAIALGIQIYAWIWWGRDWRFHNTSTPLFLMTIVLLLTSATHAFGPVCR